MISLAVLTFGIGRDPRIVAVAARAADVSRLVAGGAGRPRIAAASPEKSPVKVSIGRFGPWHIRRAVNTPQRKQRANFPGRLAGQAARRWSCPPPGLAPRTPRRPGERSRPPSPPSLVQERTAIIR